MDLKTVAQESALARLHERLIECDTQIPMLPSMADEIIALTSDTEVPVAKLSRIVSKDPVLASRMLALANSAYSAPRQPISTVTQAIVRLGTTALRNLVISVSLYSHMYDQKIYGSDGRRYIDHGIGAAYLARLLSDLADVNAEEIFLAGLLHDIGKLVILKLSYDLRRQTGLQVPPEEFANLIRDEHAAVGGRVLRRWNLPSHLDEPVCFHHDFKQAVLYPRETRVIYLANRLSHRYGFGCDAETIDLLADPVCAEFGIDQEWLEHTDQHAPGLYNVAREVLS